jgi:hypothetical protein
MQFFLAIAQRHPKLVFQLIKIVKLPPDLREFFVQAAADRRARSQPRASQFQQVSNLAEGKSESLHTPDKFQSLDISFAVLTETAGGARRTRQERIPLIEANRIGRQPNLLATVPICMIWPLPSKLTPWSIVQGQGCIAFRGKHG